MVRFKEVEFDLFGSGVYGAAQEFGAGVGAALGYAQDQAGFTYRADGILVLEGLLSFPGLQFRAYSPRHKISLWNKDMSFYRGRI